MFSLYYQPASERVKLNIVTVTRVSRRPSLEQEASSCCYLAQLAAKKLIGLLECARQRIRPITFQLLPSPFRYFDGLFTSQTHKINTVDLGNVPLDVPSYIFILRFDSCIALHNTLHLITCLLSH